MDEHFLISSNQASKLLPETGPRSIYYQEICMDNFWLFNSDSAKTKIGLVDEVGSCLRTLRRSRDLQWGIRKKVVYVPKHRDSSLYLPSVEVVRKKEVPKKRLRETKGSSNKVGKNVKQGMTEREIDEEYNLRVQLEKQFSCGKRKREGTCTKGTKLNRKERRETKELETKGRTENEGSCRWSAARYEYAKKTFIEVIRKMGATWRNPVLRLDLRNETRKRIGDLGLLDHLLKHTVGMVVADGTERLVRRHNSEGAIEYWLEPADLVQIRRRAGITDPYWVPPHSGWKPGNIDSICTCHGHCKKIASQLRAENNLLRSEIEELKSLKETEKLTIEQCQGQLQIQAVDLDWQEKHDSLLIQHRKLQKQLTTISTSFLAMKEEICSLKEEKEKRRPDELAMGFSEPSQANSASKMQFVQEKEKGKQAMAGNEVGEQKITEMKNGFKIDKPRGTFLQPSMASDSSYSSHFTSSATSTPQLLLLPSPTSSLSPQCPAFFHQPLQNSQCKNQTKAQAQAQKNQTQAQSQATLAQSQALCLAPQPSAGYLSPGMENYGESQMECDELILAMVPPTDTNSKEY
ncbi:protein AMEIOTIC 1-like [Carex rostrata]